MRGARMKDVKGKVMQFNGETSVRTGDAVDACASVGPSVEDVARGLDEASRHEAEAGELRALDTSSLTRLIGYVIDKHHVFARQQLACIDALLMKLTAAHARQYPELVAAQGLFKRLREELLFHMEKEETSLFPHIIRMEDAASRRDPKAAFLFGSVRHPIRMMMHEHDELCEQIDRIRETTRDYTPPEGACQSYRTLCQALRDLEADLLQLIYVEDAVLYPRALRMEQRGRA